MKNREQSVLWNTWWSRALLAVVVSFMLASCASMKWKKPQVSLADVRVTKANFLESHLLLTLRVHNENDKDITLDGLSFDMLVGDFVFARGTRSESIVLGRMADTLVDIDATVRTLDVLSRLPQWVQGDGRVEYVVKGEAVIRGYGNVPFDHKDSLDISKLTGRVGHASSSSAAAVVDVPASGATPPN